jgi:hypothetical protein
MGQPSNRTIVGVGILLFTGVLMGVGIHHLVSTGTCSSTGYSSNYGPVPYCPSGTGWWMAFLFIGIIGGIAGGFLAGGSSAGLINGAIFTSIGVGSFTVVFDQHTSSKAFAAVFGGCFAVVGGIILLFVLASVFRSARPAAQRGRGTGRIGSPPSITATTSAFGRSGNDADPIMGSYMAGQGVGAKTSLPGSGLSNSSVADSGLGSASADAVGSSLDSLSKLADLHQSGALTDDEFAREKAKLLGS